MGDSAVTFLTDVDLNQKDLVAVPEKDPETRKILESYVQVIHVRMQSRIRSTIRGGGDAIRDANAKSAYFSIT